MESDKIEEIKRKVTGNSLYISRVPVKTKEEFIKLANEEFEGDYGMVVKWLMDFRSGLLSAPNQSLLEQIEVLTEEIEKLKQKPEQKTEKKVIRSVSGRVIATKEE